MAKVSLTQAAKDTGVSLPTLSRWRKSGKISAEKNGNGGYIIDTSEYDRIQDLHKQSSRTRNSMKGVSQQNGTPSETPDETRSLRIEVEVLRERVKDKEELITGLREDRDDWKKQAQTLLLQAPSNKDKASENEQPSLKISEKAESSSFLSSETTNIILVVFLALILFGLLGLSDLKNWSATSETIIESQTLRENEEHPITLPLLIEPPFSRIP